MYTPYYYYYPAAQAIPLPRPVPIQYTYPRPIIPQLTPGPGSYGTPLPVPANTPTDHHLQYIGGRWTVVPHYHLNQASPQVRYYSPPAAAAAYPRTGYNTVHGYDYGQAPPGWGQNAGVWNWVAAPVQMVPLPAPVGYQILPVAIPAAPAPAPAQNLNPATQNQAPAPAPRGDDPTPAPMPHSQTDPATQAAPPRTEASRQANEDTTPAEPTHGRSAASSADSTRAQNGH
ncbi:uncharacterized protein LY89DRAFT_721711 [Mollisia scopiformis]|uniref:Uncharacterized protein n=1 Tax=Mollisia scopiformis TaxID=149040 RepID=A0A194WY20_MOLSC|nr:uncharacterized protein LY89DRAFT_721711 [Mollisia scopiformis]KUJ12871.1 hypothetical protein LY89DRAFT_721711 [Mollisia scopiformis]